MTGLFRTGASCALAILLAACASAVKEPGPSTPVLPSAVAVPPAAPAQDKIYRETGVASWYGKEFHGRKTASGEVFDMYALSAAHRTLPLGTAIRVTNLDNFKSIKVTVNDRGPLVKNRVLELSYGAAKELGFVEQGVARVKIETLEAVPVSARYTVQAATFTEEENARMLRERLSKKFEHVFIVLLDTNIAHFYQVRIGSYPSEERAELVAGKLTLEGLEPLVLRKD
jgi:rare lipoprotein A